MDLKVLDTFPYFKFVCMSLVGIWGWETYLNLRQRSKLQNKTPPKVLLEYELTTEKKFVEAQEYGYDKNSFQMFKDVWEVFTTFFWLSMGYSLLWDFTLNLLVRFGYDSSYAMVHSVLFVILFNLIGTIEGVPFDLYSTFVIEEKHGFNKTTPMTFITDRIKNILISIVFSAIVLPIILYVIEWGGDNFVFYVWLAVSIIIFIIIWIYPMVIMPMYNKMDPLEEDSLKPEHKTLVKDLQNLAKKLNFPLKKLFVMDGSKRSGHSNAFQYGFCGNKRIVLFDTILEQATTEEIVSILAHELGHWYYSHIFRALIVQEIQFFALFFGFSLVYKIPHFFNEFGFSNEYTMIGLLLFMHLWSPVNSVLIFFMNSMTRYHEYQADSFACDLDYSKSLYSGLVKIHSENKANLDPDWLFSSYHHSHPPLLHRLRAIQRIQEKKK